MSSRLPTEERQAEIVAAAMRLARDTSPALISTQALAAEVGVSQGAVFKHFPTKEAIWLAAMGWVHTQLLQVLHQATRQAAGPLQALEAVFLAHMAFVQEHPGAPHILFHELQQPADSAVKAEARKLMQAYRKLITQLLKASIEARQLPAGVEQETAATLFIGMVQGLVMQSMLGGRGAAAQAQARAVFAIFLRGLKETP